MVSFSPVPECLLYNRTAPSVRLPLLRPPSCIICVQPSTPVTQGMPYSRAMMAPCCSVPLNLHHDPCRIEEQGVQLGSAALMTSISPFSKRLFKGGVKHLGSTCSDAAGDRPPPSDPSSRRRDAVNILPRESTKRGQSRTVSVSLRGRFALRQG